MIINSDNYFYKTVRIFQYLAKEVFITLTALTLILLLIFMSNQLVHYLNRVAEGQIPVMVIMKLMMLELPNLIGLLLPLGLFTSLLTVFGKLYTDSEMTVMHACGYSTQRLTRHTCIMASFVAACVALIVFWLGPVIATERTMLLRTAGIQTFIKTVAPGRFQVLPGDRRVFYVENMNHDHTIGHNIFMASYVNNTDHPRWDIWWASQARLMTDKALHEDYIMLQSAKSYEGFPGRADYQIAHLDTVKIRLPHPTIVLNDDLRTLKTRQLLPYFNADPHKAAELQWRLSIPVMVYILSLFAVPLSRVRARGNKYAHILPGILLFFLYANLLFLTKDAIASGKIPIWFGVWGLHTGFLCIALWLIQRNR